MGLKNLKSFIKHIKKDVLMSSKKKFHKLADLIVKRAKRYHKYKNISGTLTKSTNWEKSGSKINFYTINYGKWVAENTNNNWIYNASNYYKRNKSKWSK